MRPTDAELGWLAGIVDGEGTINLSHDYRKANGHMYLRAHFHVVNTDMRIIEKCRRIVFDIVGKPPSVKVSNKNRPVNHKLCYRLAVNTQGELLCLLPVLAPFLVAKREQAELVIDFCKRRSHRLAKRWHQFKEQDDAVYNKLRELNRRGVQEQTALTAPVTVQ